VATSEVPAAPRAVGSTAPPKRGRRQSDVDAFGRSERFRAVARLVFAPVYRWWFRVEWEGLEHVPASGGALLVANHAGALPPDAAVILHGIEEELGRPVYGLADHLFRDLPLVGTVWSRVGGVVGHPDNAERLLRDDGALVLVFPEGAKGPAKTYRHRYQLRRFGRGGFVEIAMRAGVPIIPIAVVGAEEAMPSVASFPDGARWLGLPYLPLTANQLVFGPLGALTWFPAKLRLRVLPPVTFDQPPGLPRYSRSRVMDAADAIRLDLQAALFDMLRSRGSIWLG
jgi:1-acyl-sn-glycerol-3-phosphate acyltransferase